MMSFNIRTENVIVLASETDPDLGSNSTLSASNLGSGFRLGGGAIAGIVIAAAIALVGFLLVLYRWQTIKGTVGRLLPKTDSMLQGNESRILGRGTLEIPPAERETQGPNEFEARVPVEPQPFESANCDGAQCIEIPSPVSSDPNDFPQTMDSQAPPGITLPTHPPALLTVNFDYGPSSSEKSPRPVTWPSQQIFSVLAQLPIPAPRGPQITPRNVEYGYPPEISTSGKTPLEADPASTNDPQWTSSLTPHDSPLATPAWGTLSSVPPQIDVSIPESPAFTPGTLGMGLAVRNRHGRDSIPPQIEVLIPGSPAFDPEVLNMGAAVCGPHGEASVRHPHVNVEPSDVVRKPQNRKEHKARKSEMSKNLEEMNQP